MLTQRLMTALLRLLAVLAVCLLAHGAVAEQTVYYEETWENGVGVWSASSGVWQVGEPSGGCTAFGGSQCAATNLTGNYPRYTDTRLESPSIQLPTAPADGELWLYFWHWFALYRDGDYARVEISTTDNVWVPISSPVYNNSGCWSPLIVDLSSYAGQQVKIGFRLIDMVPYGSSQSWGWYVDDISIRGGKFPWLSPETFDNDGSAPEYGGWYADRGVWQIGVPSYGLSAPWAGQFCAGTRMDSSYPRYANSRLVSPRFEVPNDPLGGEVWLSFVHWFRFYRDGDYGKVEVFDDGSWQPLSGNIYHSSGRWSECILDLAPYRGQTIRIGFRIADAAPYGASESYGWFIDDVAVVEGPAVFNNPDGFEGGSRGWAPNNGVWEIGMPTNGPGTAYSGEHCWGTNLTGNYPRYTSSELLSSWLQLPDSPSEPIHLLFKEWHSFYHDGDYGIVRIHLADGTTTNLSADITGSSDWSQWASSDLSVAYAGQKIRFGFYMSDLAPYGANESAGWYIDDLEVTGLPQSTPPSWPDIPGFNYPQVEYSAGAPVIDWFYLPFDPQYVAVYASRAQEFLPNLGNRIALLGDDPTSYVDEERPGWDYFYRVALIDDLWHESPPGPCGPPYTAVGESSDLPLAGVADLRSNFPNPFNPSTTIRFALTRAAVVTLEVFDVAGRKVGTLMEDEPLTAGEHDAVFAPRELPSGLYLCRLSADGEVQTRKMVLTK